MYRILRAAKLGGACNAHLSVSVSSEFAFREQTLTLFMNKHEVFA